MRTDGSVLPSGADVGTCVLAVRLSGRPRNRSSSPRRRVLSDVPDGGSGPKSNPFGRGLPPRGCRNGVVDVASVESVGRRPRPCGGVPTICHNHDTTSSGRCGRGRGSSSAANRRVTRVDREGVAAANCSRVTASASRLAERRPSVGEVALSHLVAVAVSSSPANIGSAFRGKPGLRSDRSRRPDHRRRARSRNRRISGVSAGWPTDLLRARSRAGRRRGARHAKSRKRVSATREPRVLLAALNRGPVVADEMPVRQRRAGLRGPPRAGPSVAPARLERPRQRGDCSVRRAAVWLRLPVRRRCRSAGRRRRYCRRRGPCAGRRCSSALAPGAAANRPSEEPGE